MEHLPLTTFRRCVARHRGEHKVKSFSCLDQYLSMGFAQLTYRESLRDIAACLRASLPSSTTRTTRANANATRDWRIYCEFAQSLIATARRLYADDPFRLDLKETVYALDATTIDLCLSVFPWTPFRSTKAAIKLPTLLDLVAIVKKRLALAVSLYEILQILSLTMFERIPLHQLLALSDPELISSVSAKQLNLLNNVGTLLEQCLC